MYDTYRSRLGEEELKAHDKELAGRIVLGGKLGDPVKDLLPVMVFLQVMYRGSLRVRLSLLMVEEGRFVNLQFLLSRNEY